MSQFLNIRKLRRGPGRASDVSESDLGNELLSTANSNDGRDDDDSDFLRPRHGSEPSEQLLSSLPQRFRRPSPISFQPSIGSHYATSSDPVLLSTVPTDSSVAGPDVLGLNLHHSPTDPDADLIFVHGLGGSSMNTWSFKRDHRNFWPVWLPSEPALSNVRIFSFGYNAGLRAPDTIMNITDFAKELLLGMLTFAPSASTGPSIRIGRAYILGKCDDDYAEIIPQIRGIMFLATPHRGSNYAHLLNRMLAASPLGTAQKEYITQLEATSSTVQDINDQFRKLCIDLLLVSFYETVKTKLAKGLKIIIVEKNSAILDYPQEKSSPLNADHHSICKFENTRDGNFIKVKNMIQFMMSKLPSNSKYPASKGPNKIPPPTTSISGHRERSLSTVKIIKRLEDILGVREPPEHDFKAHRSRLSEGSCQWVLQKESFGNWIKGSETDPHIFWLMGPPATGKSTLTSFIIDWLQNIAIDGGCPYYFFYSDHQTKRKISFFLRMMAFQLAQSHQPIQEALFKLNDETNITFDQQNAVTVWEKVFEGIIFRTHLANEMFWVIDALDEADTAVALAKMLCTIRSSTTIKLFITSRETKEFSNFVKARSEQIIQEKLSMADTLPDIEAYITRTIKTNLPSKEESQRELIREILAKASGSFLWVKLTLDTVRDNWHIEKDLRRAMMEVPEGMEPLYRRMLTNIINQTDRNRCIAKEILTWAVCSFRYLELSELQAALLPDFDGFVSLKDTISQICGHFINVNDDRVTLVHATAYQFLLHDSNGFIGKHESHERLALSCLRYLSNESWRQVFALGPKGLGMKDKTERIGLAQYAHEHPFLIYATEHWAFHVDNSPVGSDEIFKALEEFFSRHVLVWIHAVALSANLRTLIRTAQYLRAFIHKKSQTRLNTTDTPPSLKVHDVQWLRSWTVDLIRIVGKFGKVLLQSPSIIHRLIPVFCPPQSQIGSTYGSSKDSMMSLSGLSSATWDDCLARVTTGEGSTISQVLATETYFITLMRSIGRAIVWSAETLEPLQRINHGEYVTHMATDKLGTTLVTAGIRTLRTWELSSGKQIYSVPRNSEAKTMTVCFDDSEAIIIGYEDYSLQCLSLASGEVRWSFWAFERQESPKSCPKFMVISPDKSKVAVAERGRPILVWDIAQTYGQQPWRCVRSEDVLRHLDDQEAWNVPEAVCWHPEGASIFILYQDSTVVHWNFTFDEQKEFHHTGAREIVVSKDGNLILTSGSNGTLSVWAIPRFNLMYRLLYEEFARDLTLSPDGQRIYDSRGSTCNVWEPDVLTRHEEIWRDDTLSNYNDSVISEPIISQDDNSRSQITALVCDPDDDFYCCGRDDGTVAIHDAVKGERVRKVYGHSTAVSIIALEWSKSGKFLVSADDSGRVVCKRLEFKGVGKWAVFPMFDVRLSDSVRQFLFNPEENLLLISTEATDTVWDIRPKSKKELSHKTWSHYTGRRWITHPCDSTKLLWIDSASTDVFEWDTLECCDPKPHSETEHIRPHLFTTPSGTPEFVRSINATRDGRYIVCEIVPDRGTAFSPSSHGLKAQMLVSDPAVQKHPLKYAFVRLTLEELSALSIRILGMLKGRIMYLDRSFWVCSCELGSSLRSVKKHFFLPQDWISTLSLELLRYNELGTFFCSKNGEVAIVRNGCKF
ncbi:MAG: hypothetical protein Q9167_002288 [Letrouitia subvulpina]